MGTISTNTVSAGQLSQTKKSNLHLHTHSNGHTHKTTGSSSSNTILNKKLMHKWTENPSLKILLNDSINLILIIYFYIFLLYSSCPPYTFLYILYRFNNTYYYSEYRIYMQSYYKEDIWTHKFMYISFIFVFLVR